MTLIDVDGAQVWVEEHGTGEEVILSSASRFARYPAILAEPPCNYRVITVQARGFGRSTHLPRTPANGWLDTWADDAVTVADHLGIDRFIYTGVSHGAGIGWHMLLRHRDRMKAFISVVGTPHDRHGDTSSSAGRRQIVEHRRDPAVIEAAFRKIGGEPDPDRVAEREETIRGQVARNLGYTDEEARINQGMPYPWATTNEELADELRKIDIPLLILAGMRDGVIGPESTLRAAVNVARAKAVLFEDEGHYVARERPERLAREIAVFVDELNDALVLR